MEICVDFVVKGRRTEVSDRYRRHVMQKLSKVERLDDNLISLDVEVSKERNPRLADRAVRIEITLRRRGPVIRAEAYASDQYAALDVAATKLEAQLRKVCDRRKLHHGTRTPVSVAAATSILSPPGTEPAPAVEWEPAGQQVYEEQQPADGKNLAGPIHVDGEGPLVVREKVHEAKPMTLDQALYEMELVGHDFFLFVDSDTTMPSVVYRRRGYDYGVIRLRT
jgi:ribosomal subunit interface protein